MTESGDYYELEVNRLGAQGDGVAEGPNGSVYIPFSLPGETVGVRLTEDRAHDLRILSPSPQRIKPVCRHFGRCGGCALQHLNGDALLAWKRELVVAALSARGIDADIAPVLAVDAGSRRRAVFSARRTKTGAQIGYHAARSHDLIAITQCPILLPQIVEKLPGLTAIVMALASRKGELRLSITASDNGLDVLVEGARQPLDRRAREAALLGAAELGLARLTVDGDPVFQREEPRISIGRVSVALPAGAFLQPSEASQQMLIELVLAGIAGSGRVADLFCGLGTFSLPLATRAEVLGVENDASALAALAAAVARTPGLKPLATLRRDLFQDPLSVNELAKFDAVIFDPPRAGAKLQSEFLAASKVRKIIAVSCNPATLARDLRLLIDGGYRLQSVQPVDQFAFSPHVEVVACLARD